MIDPNKRATDLTAKAIHELLGGVPGGAPSYRFGRTAVAASP